MRRLGGAAVSGAFGGSGSSDAPVTWLALGIAFALHGVAAYAIAHLPARGAQGNSAQPPLEIEVIEPPPPVPPQSIPPIHNPASATVARRVSPDQPVREASRRPTQNEAPPPPNQDPPARAARNAPPVFGVTMSSVVSGEAAMAVPVGNTTMTASRTRGNDPEVQPYANEATLPFAAAPETSAATLPHVLQEVNSDDVYPPDARNLGLEGSVELSVDLDERGKVVRARVVRPAGHKFDEAAIDAMKRTVFSPARARDGRPIPFRLTYRFVFTIKN